jgi:cyclopropane-fatty-acyl-phospholipid synthase
MTVKLAAIWRMSVEATLRRLIRRGDLEIATASGRVLKLGDGTGTPAGLKFLDAKAESRLMLNPELAFGEIYMDGLVVVTKGTIYDVLLIGARNINLPDNSLWLRALNRTRIFLRRWRQRNGLLRARNNVAHHYDLDAGLYELFLDADRQYSCAYFERPDATLEDAQIAKKRHIAAKLLIEPGSRVLDIGCGWGGLGLYLAKNCGASVTGVTLSQKQLAIAQERAKNSGLDSKVEFHLQDYRNVQQTFDRIVSVGMFEHVGIGYYDTFFRKVAEVMSDDGVALIHTIGHTEGAVATNPWMEKYIFPGGYGPGMSEVLPAIERAGLLVTDVEVLRLHYAETLRAWRTRFMARRAEAAALYDERFCRMWEFYFSLCEAVFRLGRAVVFQFQLAKKVDTVPLTRDYIFERERELRARETEMPVRQIAVHEAGIIRI